MVHDLSMRHPLDQRAYDRWNDQVKQSARREDRRPTRTWEKSAGHYRATGIGNQIAARALTYPKQTAAIARKVYGKLPAGARSKIGAAGSRVKAAVRMVVRPGVKSVVQSASEIGRGSYWAARTGLAGVARHGGRVGKAAGRLSRFMGDVAAVRALPALNQERLRAGRAAAAFKRGKGSFDAARGAGLEIARLTANRAYRKNAPRAARYWAGRVGKAHSAIKRGANSAAGFVRSMATDPTARAAFANKAKSVADKAKSVIGGVAHNYAQAHPKMAKAGHAVADAFKADRALGKGARGLGKFAKWTATAPAKGTFKAGVWMVNQPQKAARLFGAGRAAQVARGVLGPVAGSASFALGRTLGAVNAYNQMAPGDWSDLGEKQHLYISTGDGKRHKIKWRNPGLADALFSRKMAGGLVRGAIDGAGDVLLGAVGSTGWLYKTDPEWKWADGDYESYKQEQDKLSRMLEDGYNPVTGEALRDAKTGESLAGAIAEQSRKLARQLRDARLEAIYERSFDPEYYRTHKDQVDAAFKEMAQTGVTDEAFNPDRSTLAPVGGAPARRFAQTAKPWETDAAGLRLELDRIRDKYEAKRAAALDNAANWTVWSAEHKGMLDAMFHGGEYTARDYLDRVDANLAREQELRYNRLLGANSAQELKEQNKRVAYALAEGSDADYDDDMRAFGARGTPVEERRRLSEGLRAFEDQWASMSPLEQLTWDARDYADAVPDDALEDRDGR